MPDDGPYSWEHGAPDAPLLVCLHGIGSCADAFEGQKPLAQRIGRRLAAWDAPGYRRSADPDSAPGIDGWADAAAAWIRRLSAGPAAAAGAAAGAIVLGVSWGGVIATRLALRRPELVAGLVLADSSCGAGGRGEAAAAMRERATEFETLGAADFARARAGLLLSDAAPAVLRDDVAAAMAESLRLPGYRWACDSMADTDHAGDLAAIAVPTLVIVGEHDRVTPPRASRLLADGIAGARLSVVAGAGHLANQEDPAAFNDAVAEWADGLAAGALG